jgi:hypothetical protein
MMETKHGGNRKNSGRKPVSDKKIQVSFYIKQSKIDSVGGIEKFKEKVQNYIEQSTACYVLVGLSALNLI